MFYLLNYDKNYKISIFNYAYFSIFVPNKSINASKRI